MLNVSTTYLDLYNSIRRQARFRFVPVSGAVSSISQTITDADLESGTIKRGFTPLDALTVGLVFQGGLEVSFRRDRMYAEPWFIPPLEYGKCFKLEQCYESADGTLTSEWVTLFTGWVSDVKYLTERNVWQIKAVDSAYFLGQMFASDPTFEQIVYPMTFAKLWDYTNRCLQTVIQELGLWDFSLPEIPIDVDTQIKDVADIAFRDIIANILIVAGCSLHSTGDGSLALAKVKTVKEPYKIAQKNVVFDAELAAYTKTLTRVGVANGTESWVYPPNEPRLPGFTCVFSMYSSYADKSHAEVLWANLGRYEHRVWKFRNSALPLHLEPGDHIEYEDEYGNKQNLLLGYMETVLSGDPTTSCGLGDWKTSVEIKSSGEVAFTGAGAGSSISSDRVQVSREGINYDSEDGKKHARLSNNELRYYMTGNELSDIFASDGRGRLQAQNVTLVNCAVAEGTKGSVLNMAHVLSEYDRLRVLRYLQNDTSPFVAPIQETSESASAAMGFARFELGDQSQHPDTTPRQLIIPELGPAYWLDGEPGRGIVCDPVLGSPLVGRPPMNGGGGTDGDPYQRVVGIEQPLSEDFQTYFTVKVLPLHSGEYSFTLEFIDEADPTQLNITFSDDGGNTLYNGRPQKGMTELTGSWNCENKENWLKLSVRGISNKFSVSFVHGGSGERFYLSDPVPVMVHPYFAKSKLVMRTNGWELFAYDTIPGKPYYGSYSGLKIETEPLYGDGGFRLGRDGQYIHWSKEGIKIDGLGGNIPGGAGNTLILDHEPVKADVENLDPTKQHLIIQYDPNGRTNIAGTQFSKTSTTKTWVLAPQVLLPEPEADIDTKTGAVTVEPYGDVGEVYKVEVKYSYTDETGEAQEFLYEAQEVVNGGQAQTITIPIIEFGGVGPVETQIILRDKDGTASKPKKFSISYGVRYREVLSAVIDDSYAVYIIKRADALETLPTAMDDSYDVKLSAYVKLKDTLSNSMSDGYKVTTPPNSRLGDNLPSSITDGYSVAVK